jgi:hypothetical protein
VAIHVDEDAPFQSPRGRDELGDDQAVDVFVRREDAFAALEDAIKDGASGSQPTSTYVAKTPHFVAPSGNTGARVRVA